jgi:hypothetical protein
VVAQEGIEGIKFGAKYFKFDWLKFCNDKFIQLIMEKENLTPYRRQSTQTQSPKKKSVNEFEKLKSQYKEKVQHEISTTTVSQDSFFEKEKENLISNFTMEINKWRENAIQAQNLHVFEISQITNAFKKELEKNNIEHDLLLLQTKNQMEMGFKLEKKRLEESLRQEINMILESVHHNHQIELGSVPSKDQSDNEIPPIKIEDRDPHDLVTISLGHENTMLKTKLIEQEMHWKEESSNLYKNHQQVVSHLTDQLALKDSTIDQLKTEIKDTSLQHESVIQALILQLQGITKKVEFIENSKSSLFSQHQEIVKDYCVKIQEMELENISINSERETRMMSLEESHQGEMSAKNIQIAQLQYDMNDLSAKLKENLDKWETERSEMNQIENNSLEVMIRHQEQVASLGHLLESQKRELQEKLNDKTIELEVVNTKLEKMTSLIHTIENQVDLLVEQKKDLVIISIELARNLERSVKGECDLLSELNDLKGQCHELESSTDRFIMDQREMEVKVFSLQSQLADKEETFQMERELMETELHTLIDLIEELEYQYHELYQTAEELETRKNTLDSIHEFNLDTIHELNTSVDELHQFNAKLTDEIVVLKKPKIGKMFASALGGAMITGMFGWLYSRENK